ncbi:MAG: methionyl-tRNA formyltransferase [Firmicutes bacterium]|nr:methionyl-tRNA formyltransferase [Bacillota bacterium]
MGTPEFAVPSLRALLAGGHQVVGVFTQPDKPRGRGYRVLPSPVKQAALDAGVPVLEPVRLKDAGTVESLQALAPDVVVVVAYGQILPPAVLRVPPLGCVNVHASLLPRHRGAAPIQAALKAGDPVTGVTTMFMDEGLDTGDIILQRAVPIAEDDDAGSLHDRLAALGAELLAATLELLAKGAAPRFPQDHERATYAPKVSRAALAIDWSLPADQVRGHVRAFAPRPGAYTAHRGRIIKVLRVRPGPPRRGEAGPGHVVELLPEGFAVQTGCGTVIVEQVQPSGAGTMSGRDYINGYRLKVGERLNLDEAASGRRD